ncbi:hypothetical protein TB2_010341 [Malus domestica]
MGRSRTHEDHNSDGHRAFHMEEHHLPSWHPSVNRHRQRPVICGKRFGEVLPKVRHQTTHVHAKISLRNEQDEASNKTILDCLKKSLIDKKGKWPDELPRCLWAYRTTKRRATGETHFFLAFGSKAIIHPNIIVPSINTLLPSIEQNSEEMATNLDLAEERREQTITRIAVYQQQLISSYNKRAKIRQFQPGDLVLRKAFITARREGSKKIDPIWEGPYKIRKVGSKGNYTLTTMNDKEIEKQWNAYNLRKYHV